MTEQEITQARSDLEQLGIEQLRCGVMLQLLKIEALTKERDEYAKAADTVAMAHKVERDALMSAAKLALDALECIPQADSDCDVQTQREDDAIQEAITSLRQAGVQ